jgi:hypothetical protein
LPIKNKQAHFYVFFKIQPVALLVVAVIINAGKIKLSIQRC